MKMILPYLTLSLSSVLLVQAQETPLVLKNDSPKVKAEVEKAKKTAGSEWATAWHYFCEAPRADVATDPVFEPTKIFDNVYAIGNSGTAVYVIRTSDGLMMIDSTRPIHVETQLLPGFQKLGLDPAQVKMVLITHGHADHFGGSPYFQEHYGSRVYISQGDWDLMEHPPARKGGGKGPANAIPKHDMVITEGQPIVLGDEKVMPYLVPPHTPGSMGFIFPVKDNGKIHMAALFGSVLLVTTGTTDEGMHEHMKAIAHWKEETKKAKVDVELQNHPLFDDIAVKLAKLQNRKPGDPDPFIVGQAGYSKFVDVMSECMQAEIVRREEAK